jgi:hypothetical protein
MNTDAPVPEFHLHFEGDGTRNHSVPAVALTQAVQALQRFVQLLAMAYEGRELKQRVRASHELERKYAVILGLPQAGGYDLPYRIGNTAQLFDRQDIERVTSQHQTALEAIQNGDMQALRRTIPSADFRRMAINELKKMQPPSRTGLVVSLADHRGRKLFDGETAPEKLAPLLTEAPGISIHPRLVTGRLDAMDFQKRTLSLQLPSGRRLDCSYSDDFEPILLENPREWVQVRGEAVLDEDNSLRALNNISEIIEVDTSPVLVGLLRFGKERTETRGSKQPLVFEVNFDPEDGMYTATGEFHMLVTGETRAEIERAVSDTLATLWHEYVMADEGGLSADALALRHQLAETFAGADNAS